MGNRHAEPRVSEAVATLPLRLDDGWNQIRFDIANIAERAFGVPLAEVSRVRIQATCRLARVYFATYAEADASSIPPEFLALVPGESPMWASTRSPRWAQVTLRPWDAPCTTLPHSLLCMLSASSRHRLLASATLRPPLAREQASSEFHVALGPVRDRRSCCLAGAAVGGCEGRASDGDEAGQSPQADGRSGIRGGVDVFAGSFWPERREGTSVHGTERVDARDMMMTAALLRHRILGALSRDGLWRLGDSCNTSG